MLRCGVWKRCPMKREPAVMEQGLGLRTEAYWMPFTHNRYLKKHPRSRILARADGAYYTSAEGKRLFDCISGMWCCPLGHGHPKIAEAVARQVKELDYSPAFQMGHPKIFSLAERIVRLAPAGMGHVFFGNSGSEPMEGAAGVIVPPAGYLERLRAICDKHGILLIFDEVITGFGRLGEAFGAQRFGVMPDMITFAKIVTNGVIPMGGVIVKPAIYDAFMTGPEIAVELFHGYTYSGHPMAAAAALATLDAIEEEGSFKRARELEPVLEQAVHSLKGEPGVADIRNIGLTAAVEFEPLQGKPGLRALKVFELGMEEGMLFRFTGETIAMAPPFISTQAEIGRMVEVLRGAIRATH